MPGLVIHWNVSQLVSTEPSVCPEKIFRNIIGDFSIKDVPGGIPKSVLLGVTVALTHVAGQRFLAV